MEEIIIGIGLGIIGGTFVLTGWCACYFFLQTGVYFREAVKESKAQTALTQAVVVLQQKGRKGGKMDA